MWLLIRILDIALQMIFLMMRISVDNIDHYLLKGILYCESLICVPWELGVTLTLFRTYCSPTGMYTQHNSGGGITKIYHY